MQKTKRLLIMLLALLMVALMLFAATSCSLAKEENEGEDSSEQSNNPGSNPQDPNAPHTHSYTATVVNPTCTAKGYTKHTCSCGDTYNDTEVAAAGHSYKTVVESYPTFMESGRKAQVCSVCSAKGATDSINALVLSLPQASDMLKATFNGLKLTLAAEEGSTIVWSKECSDGEGEKTFVVFEIAEADIDMKGDVPKGHIKLAFGTSSVEINGLVDPDSVVAPEEYEDAGSLYIYLNGDEVSIEVDLFEGEKQNEKLSLNEEFYSAIAAYLGIPTEQFVSMMYVAASLEQFTPLVKNILIAIASDMPTVSDDYIDMLVAVGNTFERTIVTIKTDAEGNTVYSLDIAAFKAFLAIVDDKTVAEIVDEAYGEGSAAALKSFILSLPDMKLSQIADAAIRLSESSGIAIEDIYYLINFSACKFAGIDDFDFEAELQERYNLTLAGILYPEATAEELTAAKSAMTLSVEGTLNMTFDELATLIFGYNVIDAVKESIEDLDDGVTADVTVDENGAFVNLHMDLYDAELLITVEDDTLTIKVFEGENEYFNAAITVIGDTYLELDAVISGDVVVDCVYVPNYGYVNVFEFGVIADVNVKYEKLDGEYKITLVNGDEAFVLYYAYDEGKDEIGFEGYDDEDLVSNGYIKAEYDNDTATVTVDLVIDDCDAIDCEFTVSEDCSYVEFDIVIRSNVIVGFENVDYGDFQVNEPIYDFVPVVDYNVVYEKTDTKYSLTVSAPIGEDDTAKKVYYYERTADFEKIASESYLNEELVMNKFLKVDYTENGFVISAKMADADVDFISFEAEVDGDLLTSLELILKQVRNSVPVEILNVKFAIEDASVSFDFTYWDDILVDVDEYYEPIYDFGIKADFHAKYEELENRVSLTVSVEDSTVVYYYERTETGEKLEFVSSDDEGEVANGYISVEVVKDGEVITSVTVTAEVNVEGDDYFDFEAVIEDGILTSLDLIAKTDVYNFDLQKNELKEAVVIKYSGSETSAQLSFTAWDSYWKEVEVETDLGDFTYDYEYVYEIVSDFDIKYEELENRVSLTVSAEDSTVVYYYEYSENSEKLGFVLYDDEDQLVASGDITVDVVKDGDLITSATVTVDAKSDDGDMFDFVAVIKNDTLTLDITSRAKVYDYNTWEFTIEDSFVLEYSYAEDKVVFGFKAWGQTLDWENIDEWGEPTFVYGVVAEFLVKYEEVENGYNVTVSIDETDILGYYSKPEDKLNLGIEIKYEDETVAEAYVKLEANREGEEITSVDIKVNFTLGEDVLLNIEGVSTEEETVFEVMIGGYDVYDEVVDCGDYILITPVREYVVRAEFTATLVELENKTTLTIEIVEGDVVVETVYTYEFGEDSKKFTAEVYVNGELQSSQVVDIQYTTEDEIVTFFKVTADEVMYEKDCLDFEITVENGVITYLDIVNRIFSEIAENEIITKDNLELHYEKQDGIVELIAKVYGDYVVGKEIVDYEEIFDGEDMIQIPIYDFIYEYGVTSGIELIYGNGDFEFTVIENDQTTSFEINTDLSGYEIALLENDEVILSFAVLSEGTLTGNDEDGYVVKGSDSLSIIYLGEGAVISLGYEYGVDSFDGPFTLNYLTRSFTVTRKSGLDSVDLIAFDVTLVDADIVAVNFVKNTAMQFASGLESVNDITVSYAKTENGFDILLSDTESVIIYAGFELIVDGNSVSFVYDIEKIRIGSEQEIIEVEIIPDFWGYQITNIYHFLSGEGKITLTAN